MKLKVNKDKCIGCGFCVGTCESVFEFDDDNQAKVVKEPIPDEFKEEATTAKKGCPTGAIEEE